MWAGYHRQSPRVKKSRYSCPRPTVRPFIYPPLILTRDLVPNYEHCRARFRVRPCCDSATRKSKEGHGGISNMQPCEDHAPEPSSHCQPGSGSETSGLARRNSWLSRDSQIQPTLRTTTQCFPPLSGVTASYRSDSREEQLAQGPRRLRPLQEACIRAFAGVRMVVASVPCQALGPPD